MMRQALRTFADVDTAAALLITKTAVHLFRQFATFIESPAVLLATVASSRLYIGFKNIACCSLFSDRKQAVYM